jgi:alpha,alpha-trehalose phosphorylase
VVLHHAGEEVELRPGDVATRPLRRRHALLPAPAQPPGRAPVHRRRTR